MAVLGGGKKKKRTKNKTETVTVNADGSRTVTVTKNKTRTKTKSSNRNTTPRKKIAAVSTLKSEPIKRVKPKNVKINATPKKERPQKVKEAQSNILMRKLIKRAEVRESQPLAPSPTMRNSVPNGRDQ